MTNERLVCPECDNDGQTNERLVCPECGNDGFTQRHYAVLETTVYVYPYGLLDDISDEILDDERDGELTCTDCGETYDLDSDLIPESEYQDAN